MEVNAEFTMKIKINDFPFPNNISAQEVKKRVLEEGEKRLRYYTSGFLLDPEGKVVSKDIKFEIKQG
jgi:hypothetical protein